MDATYDELSEDHAEQADESYRGRSRRADTDNCVEPSNPEPDDERRHECHVAKIENIL